MDAYQSIIEALSRAKRVLITTHVRPDGDALGTAAAVCLALRSKNIDSEVLLLSHLPTKYAFVFRDNQIVHHQLGDEVGSRQLAVGSEERVKADSSAPLLPTANPQLPTLFSRFDLLLVVDTGTWSQLPGLEERITSWNVPKIVIDHHLTQQNWATIKLVDTRAAAAGEIMAELLARWGIALTPAIAQALFLAIASDTGWFQFSNTTPRTLRLAASLMEAGVDTDAMYQHLYQNERAERVALQTRALQSLELHANNRIAVMRLRREDFAATGARVPDTENIINFPLQIQTVEVSLLFVEPPEEPVVRGQLPVTDKVDKHLLPTDNSQPAASSARPTDDSQPATPHPEIRVSLRSKGQIDVARFAEQFGGGGHARAAGLRLHGPLGQAAERVLAKLEPALNPVPAERG